LILAPEIERRIREFLDADEEPLEWLKPIVRRYHFLPLYLGWISTLGLRPDGSFVRWDHENDPDREYPLGDAFWQRMALHQGMKKYPELTPLLPARPPHAFDCEICKGTGEIALPLICDCGGAGWKLPGEPRDPSPG
jgi:hypothetical protein